jgi:hypothetical protein
MYTCIRVLVEKHLVSKFSDSKRNQVAETWHVKILQYICSHHSNLYLWFRNRNSVLFFFWSHLPSASALPFPRVPLFSRVEVDTHTHTRTHTVYGQCLHGPLYLQLLSLTCLVTNLGCLSCAGFHVLVFIWSPNTLTQRACSHEAGGVPGRKRTRFQCVCMYVCMHVCAPLSHSYFRYKTRKVNKWSCWLFPFC